MNEICSNVVLKYSSTSMCRCSDGFRRNKIWENCTDIDECREKAGGCDQSTTDCINTLGSYKCVCKDRFVAYNTTICTGNDVNSRTIVAAVVGCIIGIAVTVATAVTVLLVYNRRRNRHTKSCQDNELKSRASANEVEPYSSEVHDSGRTIGSHSNSNVEDPSQNQQALDRSDGYASLKDDDIENRIYTSLQ